MVVRGRSSPSSGASWTGRAAKPRPLVLAVHAHALAGNGQLDAGGVCCGAKQCVSRQAHSKVWDSSHVTAPVRTMDWAALAASSPSCRSPLGNRCAISNSCLLLTPPAFLGGANGPSCSPSLD